MAAEDVVTEIIRAADHIVVALLGVIAIFVGGGGTWLGFQQHRTRKAAEAAKKRAANVPDSNLRDGLDQLTEQVNELSEVVADNSERLAGLEQRCRTGRRLRIVRE